MKINIFYWATQKFDDLPWEHNESIIAFDFTDIVDQALDAGYYVMIKKNMKISAMVESEYTVFIDNRRFTQR